MDKNLIQINSQVYDKCDLSISDFELEAESKEYDACRFKLNGRIILSRSAKITPKKAGLFVTFWKRNQGGTIEPLEERDKLDYYVVNTRSENQFGQFVFPKSVLLEKGIVSTDKKEGKRAFRVYPSWTIAKSKQAEQTQKWQLYYFYQINDSTDYDKVLGLYVID